MDRGRKICDVLKAVRKKIADMNGIAYEPRVCHFKGHCSGTCPACETERKYIESELSLRKRMGEAVCVTGVAIGILATPYNVYAQTSSPSVPIGNEVIAADSLPTRAQVTINGCVKDADGTPIVGVIIVVGNKRPGRITDIDGNFSVTLPRDSTLRLKYIGYKNKVYSFSELDLKGFNTLCLTEADYNLLGEMVVVAPQKPKTKKRRKKKQEGKMVVENKDFDTGPFYPGGNSALLHFVEQNLCVPETLQGAYQQRINVSFYVLGDGSLADVKVITICPQEMKEEVLRLVKAMPKWKPALKDGKPTCAKIMIPIDIMLK